jgi:hypothetical protein
VSWIETFKFSAELDAKVSDVIGLYLNPTDNAIVLSLDEKSQPACLPRWKSPLGR